MIAPDRALSNCGVRSQRVERRRVGSDASTPRADPAGLDRWRRLAVAAACFGLLIWHEAGRAMADPAPSSVRVGLSVGTPVGFTAALDANPWLSAHLLLSPAAEASELGLRLDVVYRPPGLGGDLGSIGKVSFWFGPGLRWTTGFEA